MSTTRGIRNNNLLNIRRTKDRWIGMSDKQTDKQFVQFDNRLHGYRAGFIILNNYLKKGINTIGTIIARWAPSSDNNNTQAYIEYVAKSTDIRADEPLRFDDQKTMVGIVQSMVMMECGILEDKDLLQRAYVLAYGSVF